MSSRISIISMMLFFCLNVLYNVQHVYAQDELALGEMRVYGDVFIRSSTGNWMPAPNSYPILQNTEISTKKGSVSLYYKDGSRIDLSESTMASLGSANSRNTVHLAKGKLKVNTSPRSSFIFSSGTTDIVIKRSFGKRDVNPSERFLGIVSSDDKGIEVQSISGVASLKANNSMTKDIPSGGSIFIGADNEYSTYQSKQKSSKSKKCYKHKKPHKHCSPHTFYDDDEYCHDD